MTNQAVYNELTSKYQAHFGFEPEVVAYAPGRFGVLGIVRFLLEVVPKFFLFENVAGIKKEDLCLVDELLGGNKIKINSSSFSAQNRERYYWSNIELQAPKNTSNLKIKDILINNPNPNLFINLKINRLIKKEGINISPKGLVFIGGITNNKVNKWIDNEKILSRNFKQGYRVYSEFGKSPTLTANGGGLAGKTCLIYNEGEIRRLGRTEAERLQNIPDGYTSIVSESQALEAIGNGWTVGVIKFLLSKILRSSL